MADPKLKFTLTVDDQGSIKINRFGKTADDVAGKGSTFGAKMAAAARGVGSLAADAATAAIKVGLLGGGMAAFGVAAMGITKSVGKFAEFEVALNRVGNVSSESLEKVKQKIFELDPALGGATELTKGYYQVMSAGVTDSVKSMDLLVTASKAAKEANLEQGEVVRGMAALMGAYSGEIDKASMAADTLYTIEKLGITSVGELIPYIGNLANLSASAGLSLDEMAASLAQVTASGAGTSIATTQLQALLKGMLDPSKELTEVFKQYGGVQKAIADLGFAGVLQKIKEAAGGTAAGYLQLFGQAEAVQAILQLQKNDFGDLNTKLGEMEKKTGAAESAWGRYKETLSAIWDTFKNTIGNQLILIGEKLAPKIKEVVELCGEWLEANRDIITQDIGEWVSKTFTAIDKLAGSLRTGYTELKTFVGWVDHLYDKLSNFISFIEKYKLLKLSVGFFGVGSSELPLSEKINEMEMKMDHLSMVIESLNPKFTVDATPATEALGSVAQTAEKVSGTVSKGISDMVIKLQTLEQAIATLESTKSLPSSIFGTYSKQMAVQDAEQGVSAALKREQQWEAAKASADLLRSATPFNLSNPTTWSYQSGTGMKGLPYTGSFYGHAGEIVLNHNKARMFVKKELLMAVRLQDHP